MINNLVDTRNIRDSFKRDYLQWDITLPNQLYPYGKFNHAASGWEFIYSFDIDENLESCLNVLCFHRMTSERYTRYKQNGENDELDCDDSDEFERLYGFADFDQYRSFDYQSNKPFTLFWENTSAFSQWHKCSFKAFSLTFCAAEQYMMYMKAMLFQDYETAKKIISTTDVRKQKELGRQVKGFEEKRWQYHCRHIVYNANKYKFLQNAELLQTLLETEGTILVESSPYDKIWGIGLSAENPKAQDRATWEGKNWLGYILSMLREDIIYKIENSEEWFIHEIEDKPLNDCQYDSLLKGYQPDFDCRYAPIFLNGYFYITRSGYWVKKFKYQKQLDGLYHITEHYTTSKEGDRDLLEEIYIFGYFSPRIYSKMGV